MPTRVSRQNCAGEALAPNLCRQGSRAQTVRTPTQTTQNADDVTKMTTMAPGSDLHPFLRAVGCVLFVMVVKHQRGPCAKTVPTKVSRQNNADEALASKVCRRGSRAQTEPTKVSRQNYADKGLAPKLSRRGSRAQTVRTRPKLRKMRMMSPK